MVINELEGGRGTILFNSGLAAISSVFLNFLKKDDHLVKNFHVEVLYEQL